MLPQRLGTFAERNAVLRSATDARKPTAAKAISTGHHRKVSLHFNSSPPHLPESLEDRLP